MIQKNLNLYELVKIEEELQIKESDFFKKYYIIRALSTTKYGSVLLGYNIRNKKLYILKYYTMNYFHIYEKEKYIMEKCKSIQNISKIYESYIFYNKAIIVMEYKYNETLLSYVNKYIIPEKEAYKSFIKLITIIKDLHNLNIIHRDIKPSNILVKRDIHNNIQDINLIDFSCSAICSKKYISGKYGTKKYMAPEINKKYNNKVDIYSLGIVLYAMLCGEHPFYDINNKLKSSNKSLFTETIWKSISSEGKNLISRMLEEEPEKRITIDEIFNHLWIIDHNFKEIKITLKNISNKLRNNYIIKQKIGVNRKFRYNTPIHNYKHSINVY